MSLRRSTPRAFRGLHFFDDAVRRPGLIPRQTDLPISRVVQEKLEREREETHARVRSPESVEKRKPLTKRTVAVVDERWIGESLLSYALDQRPEWGKEVIYKLIRSGHIYRMNNQNGRSLYGPASSHIERNQLVVLPEALPAGMERFVPLSAEECAQPRRQFSSRVRALAENWVLFKNEHVIVLNKPPGIPMLAPKDGSINIQDMLPLWRYTKDMLPTPAHSLDKETSGCLVLARTPSTQRMLHHAFIRKSVPNQCYWAFLTETPKSKCARIKMHLEIDRQKGGDHVVVTPRPTERSKASIMEYVINERLDKYGAWVSFYPMTSVRNQIRIGAAHALKCPIFGDARYGGEAAYPQALRTFWDPDNKGVSLHLHHRRVQLPYKTASGEWISVDAPLHPHMKRTWQQLGWNIDALDPFVI